MPMGSIDDLNYVGAKWFQEHWPFLGCPYFSHVVLCKACFGLYLIIRARF